MLPTISSPSPKMTTYFNLYWKGIALGTVILKGGPKLPPMRFDLHGVSCREGMTSQETSSLPLCQASVMSTPVTLAGRHSPDGLSALKMWATMVPHSFIAKDKQGLDTLHQGDATWHSPWVLSFPWGDRGNPNSQGHFLWIWSPNT